MFSRRGPPDNERFREREFPDRKERYHEEGFSSERYVQPCFYSLTN